MNFGSALRRRSSRRLRAVALPVIGVAAALALTACGGGGKSGGGGNTNFVSTSGGIDTVAKGERGPAVKMSGETLTGKQLDVADLKGKVVVLNVWGSWCSPCREEAPYLVRGAEDLGPKGVAFVGINTRDESKGPAIAFEKDSGLTYPSFYDPAGKLILNSFPKGTLNPQGIPSTIVLDRQGKIAARSLGGVNTDSLHKMIDPLIAEK